MTQKVKMHALGTDDQYMKIHPETSADQVLFNEATGQTIAQALGDVTKLQTVKKDVVGAINEVKQYGNSVKQGMVDSLLSVDSSLPITNTSSWEEINASVGNIQTGSVINGIIEEYMVQAGENVNAGDFVKFISNMNDSLTEPEIFVDDVIKIADARLNSIHGLPISDTRVLVLYSDRTSTNLSYFFVTLTGTKFTTTPITVLRTAKLSSLQAVLLSTTKAIITFRDTTNTNAPYAAVLTISGDTVTIGAENVLIAGVTASITTLEKIDATRALYAVYTSADVKTTVMVLTLSGTTISKGTAVVHSTANKVTHMKFAMNSTTQGIFAYTTSALGLSFHIFSLSGTTPTFGSMATIISGLSYSIQIQKLATGKMLTVFNHTDNDMKAFVTTISGSSFTSGNVVTLDAGLSSAYQDISVINENLVLMSHMSFNSHYNQIVTSLSINGNDIVPIDRKGVTYHDVENTTITNLGNGTFLMLFGKGSSILGAPYNINGLVIKCSTDGIITIGHPKNDIMNHFDSCIINDTTALVVHDHESKEVRASLLTFSEDKTVVSDTITLFTKLSSGSIIRVSKLDSTRALVSFVEGDYLYADHGNCNAVVVNIYSDKTIAAGPLTVISTGVTTSNALEVLSPQSATSYTTKVNTATVNELNVEGDTISIGSVNTFTASHVRATEVIDNDRILVAFKVSTNTNNHLAVYNVKNGILATSIEIGNTSDDVVSVSKINDTTFIVAFKDKTTLKGCARIVTLNGSALVLSDIYTFSAGSINSLDVKRISDDRAVVSYVSTDTDIKSHLYVGLLKLSGTLIIDSDIRQYVLTRKESPSVEIVSDDVRVFHSGYVGANELVYTVPNDMAEVIVAKTRQDIMGVAKVSGSPGDIIQVTTL